MDFLTNEEFMSLSIAEKKIELARVKAGIKRLERTKKALDILLTIMIGSIAGMIVLFAFNRFNCG